MPIGSKHALNGSLQLVDGRLRLRTAEGGTWRLHAPASAYKVAGQQVALRGARVGFDEIDVEWIEARQPGPSPSIVL